MKERKRKILTLISATLLFAMLASCSLREGRGDTTQGESTTLEESDTPAQATEEITTADVLPEGVKLTMSQISTVNTESYRDEDKYSEYIRASEKRYLVPGLVQNTVPQGLSVSPDDGRIYVSSYSNLKNTPSVILVMNKEGVSVAEYFIRNSDGTPFTGHVGGIAVTEHYMYVAVGSDGEGTYCLAEFKLSEFQRYGTSDIKIEKTVSVPSGTGFLSYADGILWTGNFYLKGTYDLGSKFNFTTTVDGKAYGGYAAAYSLDKENARLVEDDKLGYAKPSFVLAVPDKVQGFAYRGGKVFLSISYGRKNDSFLSVYSFVPGNTKKTVEIDNVSYDFETLGQKNHVKTFTLMPMTEGLTFDTDGRLLVLFESAAMKYADSRCPTAYIWATEF